ncbi:MAG: universal stress protein [Desulfobacterales bacterium]|nr:universal stress protein [Desulfobacterales bacterium]
MYKTILVPLDGSKRAEAILPHVEEVAHRYKAKVIFLHVMEPSFIMGTEGAQMALFQQELKDREKQIESYLQALKGEFREKGIETRTQIVYGPPVEAIISAADRENVDLIAIASHGRGGLSQVFYGSVAAGVLHRIDRPLLLIRSKLKK